MPKPLSRATSSNPLQPMIRPSQHLRISVMALTCLLMSGEAAPQQDFDDTEVYVLPVQGNVYMIVGAGGNIAMQVGDDGVLLVDTQFARVAEKVHEAIRAVTSKPIVTVINTHVHPDHVGGNAFFRNNEAHDPLFGQFLELFSREAQLPIYAHENVMFRATEPEPTGISSDLWPTITYFTPEKELYLNGEGIKLIHQPAAHTDGDSFVHFRGSDVVAAGDVYSNVGFPVFDRARGGTINGTISALRRLLDLIISRKNSEGGTMVIPGHGRIADEADVVEYRDMAVIVRDRIRRMVEEGRSLDEVLAAEPTLEYDGRYGAGFWSTEKFVEELYLDLGGDR